MVHLYHDIDGSNVSEHVIYTLYLICAEVCTTFDFLIQRSDMSCTQIMHMYKLHVSTLVLNLITSALTITLTWKHLLINDNPC